MKTITPIEALQALADGKSIMSSWDESPARLIEGVLSYSKGVKASLNGILEGKNLRICEEPIKVALYAYFNGDDWNRTGGYYKDDTAFTCSYSVTMYKRLDGTNGTKDTTMLVDEY